MKYPTHVVVDTIDGYTWAKDMRGESFTQLTATGFARAMNQTRKPGHKTYALFRLVPEYSLEHGQYTLSDDGKVVYPL